MTTPSERARALLWARRLLMRLLSPRQIPRVPTAVREEVRGILRHFPEEHELGEAGPEWFRVPSRSDIPDRKLNDAQVTTRVSRREDSNSTVTKRAAEGLPAQSGHAAQASHPKPTTPEVRTTEDALFIPPELVTGAEVTWPNESPTSRNRRSKSRRAGKSGKSK